MMGTSPVFQLVCLGIGAVTAFAMRTIVDDYDVRYRAGLAGAATLGVSWALFGRGSLATIVQAAATAVTGWHWARHLFMDGRV